ncbi:MAG: CheW domain-containing protein [Desulfobacterales bacterium]|nr:CheW domain-containing protein [Desulfobacterales bacterium]
MKTTKPSKAQNYKVVTANTRLRNRKGQNIHLIFTTHQVEEVLLDITMLSVPFVPSFLRGLCLWRGHVMPVVDIGKLFGFSGRVVMPKERFFVVQTGMPKNSKDKKILRCVLHISGEIYTSDIAEFYPIVDLDQVGVEPSFVRGAYKRNNNVYIVPDLASILQNDNHS